MTAIGGKREFATLADARLGVMRHTILLSIVVIASFTGCGGQTTRTTTPPKAKKMSCTLDICGDKKIQNPTESDIRQAVFALDTKKGDAFLILGPTEPRLNHWFFMVGPWSRGVPFVFVRRPSGVCPDRHRSETSGR